MSGNIKGVQVTLTGNRVWAHESTDIDVSVDDKGLLKVMDFDYRADHGEHSGIVLLAREGEWSSVMLIFGESGRLV